MKRPERPRVIANFARTADGKISTRNHTPSGFTSNADLRRLLEIRAMGDAVIVGRNTLAADSMSMTLRDDDLRQSRLDAGRPAEPLRVMISATGNLNPKWKVFQTAGARRVIFSTTAITADSKKALTPLADLHLSPSEQVDLGTMLRTLRNDYGVKTLVCEGGPTLFRGLAEIGAMDQVYLTFAPCVFGGAEAPTLTGTDPQFFPAPVKLRLQTMETKGGECYASYQVRHTAP